jgi:hypothetical protein
VVRVARAVARVVAVSAAATASHKPAMTQSG